MLQLLQNELDGLKLEKSMSQRKVMEVSCVRLQKCALFIHTLEL
jgi:hypothetical protein